jgi:hypothetical protein
MIEKENNYIRHLTDQERAGINLKNVQNNRIVNPEEHQTSFQPVPQFLIDYCVLFGLNFKNDLSPIIGDKIASSCDFNDWISIMPDLPSSNLQKLCNQKQKRHG